MKKLPGRDLTSRPNSQHRPPWEAMARQPSTPTSRHYEVPDSTTKQASQLDSSVYDYDGVYETFQAAKDKKKDSNGEASGPKYMTSLLSSAEQRKRDQLRAKEKLLQKEREQEGNEFADKEKVRDWGV